MDARILPVPATEAALNASSPTAAGERNSIQSVDRALTLLDTIADLGGEVTLTDMRASEQHVALMRNEVVAATRALSAEYGEPG